MLTQTRGAEAQDGVEFFEQKVRPIFVDHCYKCHSSESGKAKGGFQLDTRDSLLKGGDTGPAIVAGQPEKSLLIKAVSYTDENLQMPPTKGGGGKLSDAQIAALTEWVKIGAPDPRLAKDSAAHQPETIASNAKTHWAFQPIRNPVPPKVKNGRWVKTPVDTFILSALEARNLNPSPQADRRTLIRRATFDLIGLPPTPAEVANFLADKSPDAFAKVIDRLLASPRYGERWGRHWLDIARYADTKGYVFEEERRYPYSYTYRDYVIRSFNEDLPFNQFLAQQIAADLLPLGEDKRPLAALGYLTLGRRFVNNIHDIIDDRIDVVCRGMMGLTVACARCHDHKYDPIPTRDYYSLYGVFASSMEPDEEPLLGMKDESKAHDEYVAEHQKRVQEKTDYRLGKELETARKLRQQAGDYLFAVYDSEQLTNKAEIDTLAPKRKLDRGVLQRWITWVEANAKTNHPVLGPYAVLSKFATNDFEQKAGEYVKHLPENSSINPLIAGSLASHPPKEMKQVTECYGTVLKEVDERWEALVAKSDKQNTNAAPSQLPDANEEALRQVLYAADAPANLPRSEFDRLYDVQTSQKLRELQRKIEQLDATHPGAPARAMALVDRPSPHNVHVFVRGSPDNQGPEAPRQFPAVLSPNRKPFEQGSGRLELAQAVIDPKNPLTARVLVNRLWQHHFGAALVRTPSDFGMRSDPPSNPDLLDYLATQFVQGGWSIKKLHRLLMLSSTYQQTSEDNPQGIKADPNNLLVWRMNRQRLEFEALRDSLLAVAGTLDFTAGGQSVDILTEPFSTRRTVYGYIDRQNLPGLFRTFDLASPDGTSAQRFFTTVPQQALFLMNSPFVVQQASNLVKRESDMPGDAQESRVRFLYEQVFQREPSHDELRMAKQFLQSQQSVASENSAGVWQFGYGEYDVQSATLKKFKRLPHFTGTEFQGGNALPDPALGWVMLTETGGHAGNDLAHAAVRRWVAPEAMEIKVSGSFSHGSEHGDGVRGHIISSRLGELGHWSVHNSKADTAIENVKLEKGDSLDFVTDCVGSVDYDSFTWTVSISKAEAKKDKKSGWDSQKDFAVSARSQREPLTAWQKYAQVLLLANEFVFVD